MLNPINQLQRRSVYIRLFAAVLALLAGLAGGVVRAAEPLRVDTAPLELNPEQPDARRLGALSYLGGLILASPDRQFGGYSGLAVDAEGAGAWAVSDQGHWLRLDFEHGRDGVPAAVARAALGPLAGIDGQPLRDKRWSDAEALRRDPAGGFLVAFEREHRLWRYAPDLAAPGVAMALPPAAAEQPFNGGIEALATLSNGDLIVFSEEMRRPGDAWTTRVWQRRGQTWSELGWPLEGGFRVTDAVALPGEAGLLVLERDFRALNGWGTRLSLVPLSDLKPGARLTPRRLAEWERPYSNDNLEAMDLRRAADGALWLYLLSDDNRSSLQRTLLLVFRLDL